jgi:hypothetical protein
VAAVVVPGVVMVVVMLLLDPIAQDPRYHHFADQRTRLGVAHFGDVITNVPFIVVGVMGLWFVCRAEWVPRAFAHDRERAALVVFFAGILLTGFGSGWYHLRPDNARLVWDRLPMTLGFMGIFSAMISERISERVGVALLGPLAVVGLGSVWWWAWTEQQGRGDLRLYGLVQFYPMVGMALMLLLLPSRYTRGNEYWAVLLWYAAAKAAELFDHQVFNVNGVLSGHNLKHLFAAAGAWWVLRMLRRRRPRVV